MYVITVITVRRYGQYKSPSKALFLNGWAGREKPNQRGKKRKENIISVLSYGVLSTPVLAHGVLWCHASNLSTRSDLVFVLHTIYHNHTVRRSSTRVVFIVPHDAYNYLLCVVIISCTFVVLLLGRCLTSLFISRDGTGLLFNLT